MIKTLDITICLNDKIFECILLKDPQGRAIIVPGLYLIIMEVVVTSTGILK